MSRVEAASVRDAGSRSGPISSGGPGSVRVLGLGPGHGEQITGEARVALERAEHVLGYHPYLARLPRLAGELLHGKRLHGSDNGDELSRARHALELAAQGAHVAIVSGGDPGVFGMAAAVFEALDSAPQAERALDVAVLPGVTAMLAAAARLGAPLGNDFCAINLSDNLKPWAVVERRLELAAQAGFVIALYNPASRARPAQIHAAFERLRAHRAASAPVAFAKAVGRPDEELVVTTLGEADPGEADMRTLVVVGSEETRRIDRPRGTPWLYTPRRIDGAA